MMIYVDYGLQFQSQFKFIESEVSYNNYKEVFMKFNIKSSLIHKPFQSCLCKAD